MSTAKQRKAAAHARAAKKNKKHGAKAHKRPRSMKLAGEGTVAAYANAKREYHTLGTKIFKAHHGGLTAKEWSQKQKKARHKKSR